MDKIEFGPFTVEVEVNSLVIRRGEARLTFTPGEAGAASHIIGLARQMETFKVKPPQLRNTPWEVRFSESGTLEWVRVKAKSGIPFSFKEAAMLVEAVQHALKKYVDVNSIRGGVSSGLSAIQTPEPPIEGR